MNNQYKYEKFEKLSDAVKAWEAGESVYYQCSMSGTIYLHSQPSDKSTSFDNCHCYYRRIEVKPFECWVYVSDRYNEIEAAKNMVDLNSDNGNGRLIKMREVIE